MERKAYKFVNDGYGKPLLAGILLLVIKQPLLKHLSTFTIVVLLMSCRLLQAQQIDSIFFHLYTDSLKKGTHNYINVDGKTSTGTWLPLTSKQIDFTANAGRFEDNNLVIDPNFKEDSVVVTAVLKADNKIRKTITIYIKKREDNEKLKTAEEIMQEMKHPKRKKQVTRQDNGSSSGGWRAA
jgi:hypothetical protein